MDVNSELILIRITGVDRPGLTASFTEILSGYDVTIMDIGQANIHSTLSLGILFKSLKSDSGNIMKELLFKASDLGVNIRFYPVPVEEYEEWVSMQGKDRYILTLLGRKLSAKQITAVTHILAGQELNIDAIKRLTGRQPLDESKAGVRACIEFSLRGTPRDREEMQRELMKLSSELEVDFSFQRDNMYRRMRRLICFDMDSTLIQTECIDELAEKAGVGEQVRAITESAMRGEIDFKESFTQRVALLKGLDVSVMKELAENMPITEGVERLMFVLKRYGYKIAILSGGFTYFGEYLQKKFGIDYVYANELEVEDGKLTDIIESKVERIDGVIHGEPLDGREPYTMEEDHPVSMLMYGIQADIYDYINTDIKEFLTNCKDLETAEYLLPSILDQKIQEGELMGLQPNIARRRSFTIK